MVVDGSLGGGQWTLERIAALRAEAAALPRTEAGRCLRLEAMVRLTARTGVGAVVVKEGSASWRYARLFPQGAPATLSATLAYYLVGTAAQAACPLR